jgi:hypothetical protein
MVREQLVVQLGAHQGVLGNRELDAHQHGVEAAAEQQEEESCEH